MSGLPNGRDAAGGGDTDRRNAVRGVAWGAVESVTRAAVGLLITPLILRAFGIAGLGLWAACWSTAQVAGLFDLGIGAVYSRFTAQAIARDDAEALNGTIAAGMGFHLVATTLLAAAALVTMPVMQRALARDTPFAGVVPTVLGCAVITVLLRLVLSVFRGVVGGAQRLDLLGRIGSGVAVLEGGGAAAVILAGGGLRGMAYNALAAALLSSLLEAYAAFRLCPQLRLRPFRARRSDWREVLSFGLKVQVIRMADLLARHVPRLVLAAGPGLAVAGAYDLGARVANALTTVGTVPLPVIAPMASRLEARDLARRLLSLLDRSTRYVALLVLPLAALVMLDAPGLLLAWTGQPETGGAGIAARLLSLGAVLTLLVSPLRLTLRGMGYAGLEAVAALASSVLHLLLAVALAARFQAIGVAWSAFAAAAAGVFILATGARGIDAGRFTAELRRGAAAPVLAGLSAYTAGLGFRLLLGPPAGIAMERLPALIHLAGEGGVVLAVFVLVAAATGGIRRDDLSLARLAVREA